MKKYLFSLAILALSTHLWAQDRLVTDKANILTPTTVATLEEKLRAYNIKTTNQIAVVVVPSLNGESIEAAATKLFHEWGIGQKDKDNGVLFYWSTGDRKVRIEVGYGLEQALPDGRAGQIIRENITPHFRRSEWDAGVTDGVDAILTQLKGQPAVSIVNAPNTRQGLGLLGLGMVLGFVALLTGGLIAWVKRAQRRDEEERQSAFHRAYSFSPIHSPLPIFVPIVHQTETQEEARRPEESIPAPSYTPSSSWSSSDTGSSFGGFGGGDSGGGGASGGY